MSQESTLSHQQLVLLGIEIQSATNLLRDGCASLKAMRHTSTGIDSVWTLLALGVEKLCKVAVGLDGVNKTGVWPVNRVRGYGHAIVRLDERIRRTMEASVPDAVRPHVVREALERVKTDPIWPLLRTGLDRYGSNGRYHYLDWVGGQPDFDSPRGYWDSIEDAAVALDPDIKARFRSNTPGDFDSERKQTNLLIEARDRNWWEKMYLFWLHGCFGLDARSMSTDINPTATLPR